MDDWDDFDDFETPTKIKNDSVFPDTSGKIPKPLSSPKEEFLKFSGKEKNVAHLEVPESSNKNGDLPCLETDKPKLSVDKTSVSPGPSLNEEPAQCEPVDSPVKSRRRHPPPHVTSVLSDSEDEISAITESCDGTTGN